MGEDPLSGLPFSLLDELRERTDLAALIELVERDPVDGGFRGRCPFYPEYVPSLHVDGRFRHYHCFSCSAHGDAIGWTARVRQLPFMDAVRLLATTARLSMPDA